MAISLTRFVTTVASLVLAAQLSTTAAAAEIKVLSTIGVQSALEDLVPRFEVASGHKVIIAFGLSAQLSKRVADGEPLDVFVGTRAGVDGLLKTGMISTGSDATIASSGVGIAVRAGASRPDVSTPEALKRALLAARAIGWGNPAAGGAGAVHFAKVIERLGIADEVKAKSKYLAPGAFVGPMLTSGEVDLGVQQLPELASVSGVDIAGPLPGDLQAITVFVAGISASAREANAARALLAFLRSPDAATVFRAKGFNPE